MGTRFKLQRDSGDNASFYLIDMIDLEQVAPQLSQPSNCTSVTQYGATPDDNYKSSLKDQQIGVPDRESLAELIERGGIRAPKGPAGSVLFFDCNTLHGSNANMSPFPRSNAFFVYNSIDNRLQAPDAARRQLDAVASAPAFEGELAPEAASASGPGEPAPVLQDGAEVRRFFGVKSLDPQRVSRDADQIAAEVVKHLVGLVDADVEVKLEISADVPSGVPEDVVRTVTENAKTLKFDQHGFETD